MGLGWCIVPGFAPELQVRGKGVRLMLNKPLSVLKALLAGWKVVLDGRPSVLEDGRLYTVVTRCGPGAGEGEEVLLPLDMTLDGFLAACEALPDAEVFVLGAQVALAGEARPGPRRAGG